jgi:hypothetical protein
MMPWYLTAAIVPIAIVVFIWLTSRKKLRMDYYNVFVIGVMMIALGLLSRNILVVLLGALCTTTGIVNRQKWRVPHQKNTNQGDSFWVIAKTLIIGIMLALAVRAVLAMN